ncbi:PIN-like domain-containing protein [Nonomuraea wenchangensis]|nr:PIN domain-containing protein [Nonomuraea wenchangensis]
MSQDGPQSPAPKSSLRQAFPGYFPPDDELLRAFLTVGMVVLDTNALLDMYKLTGKARSEFLDTLRALDDRLFIPHQVGLELMRNRATVIKAGDAFPGRFRDAATKLHAEVQALKEHRRLQDDDVRGIKEAIDAAVESILRAHTDLYDHGVSLEQNIEHDAVFKELEQIVAGKVGPAFTKRDEMVKLGEKRLKEKVPPGYSDYAKDADKALGDFFLWEQAIIEAVERKLPVLIVSNDNKEDWVRKEGSYLRGPRPELVDEMRTRANQAFHLVNVKTFLTYAKNYLSATVSDSTIEEAETVQQQASRSSSPSTIDEWIARSKVTSQNLNDVQVYTFRTNPRRTTYQNRDDDPRGPWQSVSLIGPPSSDSDSAFRYQVTSPSGRTFPPPPGRSWKIREPDFQELNNDGRIYWGASGDSAPTRKVFLLESERLLNLDS